MKLIEGEYGLAPASLDEFLDLLSKADLKITNVDLGSFLKEQVRIFNQIPRLCESRFALEAFLKDVSALMEQADPDYEQRTVLICNAVISA